jgi:hypothetical protein
MEVYQTLKIVLDSKLDGKRITGKPTSWTDDIEDDL